MDAIELLGSQFAVAYWTTHLLEYLKGRSWFPFLKFHAAHANRVFSAGLALLIALGLHYSFDAAVDAAGHHVFSFTLALPTGGEFLHGLFAWVQQFAMQDGAYRLLVEKKK